MSHVSDHESREPLDVLRHSTAHVMMAALTDLFPGAKYAIGPPIQDGFYYDFELDRSIGDDELPALEEKMREIIAGKPRFERVEVPHEEAVRIFGEMGQDYKLELLRDIPDETVSLYRTGDFLDLCRGPHVENAGDIRAFKLLKVAGAYWRGDEHNPMLQRIYGTAWPSREDLDGYLHELEEAEKRDHKRLGRELELFALNESVGAGNVLWLPAGATIRRELERWIVDEELARGYQHVVTPHIGKVDLYRQSGHWDLYKDFMYPPMKFADESDELVLRPMNCPHHILVYKETLRSYRELPLRIAEIGQNYRYEKSGELMGMIRVRSFALNDAHIFCTPDQMVDEIVGSLQLALHFMAVLNIKDFWYRLSLRDDVKDKWAGSDEDWQRAEKALREALERLELPYQVGVGEAAFYGPKIDFQLRDALRREFTNSTVQVDLQLPQRFDLEYVAEDGTRQRPVMIHRGAFGSMERMTAFLIEKYGGNFPTWLSPTQVVVIPITDSQLDYARAVAERLRGSRVRVEVDDRPERMQRKIRDAQSRKVPYMAVVGGREAEARQVSVRDRSGAQSSEALGDFADRVAAEVAARR